MISSACNIVVAEEDNQSELGPSGRQTKNNH